MIDFYLKMLGTVALFLAGAALVLWLSALCGFWKERSFQCAHCGYYCYHYKYLAIYHGKTYCLACAPSKDRACYVGRCQQCHGEFPLAKMVGLEEKIICERCWRARLWPKDWLRKFKAMRKTSPPLSPASNEDATLLRDK